VVQKVHLSLEIKAPTPLGVRTIKLLHQLVVPVIIRGGGCGLQPSPWVGRSHHFSGKR